MAIYKKEEYFKIHSKKFFKDAYNYLSSCYEDKWDDAELLNRINEHFDKLIFCSKKFDNKVINLLTEDCKLMFFTGVEKKIINFINQPIESVKTIVNEIE